MALDGAFLNALKKEIENKAINGRVEKIHVPSADTVIITLKTKDEALKLLISANCESSRVHFTEKALENPQTPPMFCMLLRKALNGAKLIKIRQQELDRILFFDFAATNELGDPTSIILICELMGRHSNIMAAQTVEDGKITVIDSIKRINVDTSSFRQILPGIEYALPPIQAKLNILNVEIKEAAEKIKSSNSELSKAILEVMQGFSPLLAREVAHYTLRGGHANANEINDREKERLIFFLGEIKNNLINGNFNFTTLILDGKPKDFSFINITQYGLYMTAKHSETAGDLLDSFFADRDRINRMKQSSNDLLKFIVNTAERISRKLEAQKLDLEKSKNRELYRIYGDLLNSNLYPFQKGQPTVKLNNFYSEDNEEILISLDPLLTPVQNAQKYYTEYKKAATAEKMLRKLIAQNEEELIYIESVFDSASRTVNLSELSQIRIELEEQGYLKRRGKNLSKQKDPKQLPPLKYISSDGFEILCGRNNKQNDVLTLKQAKKEDIWCHVQKIPGSHVIITANGRDITQKAIEEGCAIAAYNSKARDSGAATVDYTFVKNIKKPPGGKPGMVIFNDFKSVFIKIEEYEINEI